MSYSWIKGGPFLEVSFVMEYDEPILKVIKSFQLLSYQIEILDNNINEKIKEFKVGYKVSNNCDILRHSLILQGYLHIQGKRKVIIDIVKLSNDLIFIDFILYGSEFDALEWNQDGISEDEYIFFYELLDELFRVFNFKIGCVGIEESVLDLFDSINDYPYYDFNRLDYDKIDYNKTLLYIKR